MVFYHSDRGDFYVNVVYWDTTKHLWKETQFPCKIWKLVHKMNIKVTDRVSAVRWSDGGGVCIQLEAAGRRSARGASSSGRCRSTDRPPRPPPGTELQRNYQPESFNKSVWSIRIHRFVPLILLHFCHLFTFLWFWVKWLNNVDGLSWDLISCWRILSIQKEKDPNSNPKRGNLDFTISTLTHHLSKKISG